MKLQLLIIVLISSLISCNQIPDSGEIHDSNKIVRVYPSDVNFIWNEFLKVDEIVSLETNEQSLLASINKFVVHDSAYFILDQRSNNLLKFSKSGKFMNQVGQRGKGPREYLEVRDFDTERNYLYVLDYKEILAYKYGDLSVDHTIDLARISLEGFNPMNFCTSGNSIFLWNGNPDVYSTRDRDFSLMYRYVNGSLEERFFDFEHEIFDGSRFYSSNNDSFFIKPADGSTSIFEIKDEIVENAFTISFQEKALPEGYFSENLKVDFNDYLKNDYFKGIKDVWQIGSDLIYFNCFGPGSYTYEGIFEKTSGEILSFGKQDFPYNPIIIYAQGNHVYGYYDVERIKRFLDIEETNGVKNEVFLNSYDALVNANIGDNPIIVRMKMINK